MSRRPHDAIIKESEMNEYECSYKWGRARQRL